MCFCGDVTFPIATSSPAEVMTNGTVEMTTNGWAEMMINGIAQMTMWTESYEKEGN